MSRQEFEIRPFVFVSIVFSYLKSANDSFKVTPTKPI